MADFRLSASWISILLLAASLTACGNGEEETVSTTATDSAAAAMDMQREVNAPQASGNTATDGFNWTNFRRQQAGLSTVSRSPIIDAAAQGHSNYQKTNNVISHEQVQGSPGFTGVTLPDRLANAGYRFTEATYAYGEVISANGSASGVTAAEDLIAAIYHRFVMFEPKFREAGAGSASVSGGYNYFTMNFAANGLGRGLGAGRFVVYPVATQQNLPTVFYSDYESPDPVAERNEVGYPVSVHADINSNVVVRSFTVTARGGGALSGKILSAATDRQTPTSAAAFIPLQVLAPLTTYDVQFSGTIDGLPVSRSWSFTTH